MISPFFKFPVLSLLVASVVFCAPSWGHEHEQPAAVIDKGLPHGGNASKPAVRKPRPQLGANAAFAPDGSLWVVGLNASNQLFVQSAPAPQGGSALQWDAPRVIDTAGDAISAEGENRPKLLFGPQSTVLIAYTQPLMSRHHDGNVRLLRSVDAGKTFSAPFMAHADRQVITHRFESIGFDAQGVMHTLWVDSRDMEAAPLVAGKTSYRGVGIYRNLSTDGGATFGPDMKVADHACECCRTAMGLGSDGVMRAMWRHVFAPNVRDHAFVALTPVAEPAIVRATFDDWRVDACPHHGPALAAAGDGFHAVWFGIRQQGSDKVAGVRYGRLQADGSPQPDTVRLLPDVRAEHADVAAHGQRVAVVWRSIDGMISTAKAWLSTDGGQTFRVQTLGQVKGDNDFPRLAQQGPTIAVVWRNPSEVQFHELKF
jgi:hypothetical protein